MPEREGGPGEGGKDREQRPAYLDARRYSDQETAARAYMEGQQALKKEAGQTDVSIFRLQFGPDLASHVVALGQTPPQALKDKLEIAFGTGERINLPDDVLAHLVARRRLASQTGPWVEGHYRPGKNIRLPKRRR